MQPEFMLSVREHGSTAIVRCTGEVDIATAPRLVQAVDVALKHETQLLEIDFSEVSFFSAAGVDVLTDIAKYCERTDTDLRIFLSRPAKRVLDIIDPAELRGRVVDPPRASSPRFVSL